MVPAIRGCEGGPARCTLVGLHIGEQLAYSPVQKHLVVRFPLHAVFVGIGGCVSSIVTVRTEKAACRWIVRGMGAVGHWLLARCLSMHVLQLLSIFWESGCFISYPEHLPQKMRPQNLCKSSVIGQHQRQFTGNGASCA